MYDNFRLLATQIIKNKLERLLKHAKPFPIASVAILQLTSQVFLKKTQYKLEWARLVFMIQGLELRV